MKLDKINQLLDYSLEGIDRTAKALYRYQQKRIIPIKSGIEHLDIIGLGGLYPDTVVAIGARPSMGKSYTANLIRTNILKDPEEDIGVLLWNLEMPFFTLLMVELKKVLKKSLKEILAAPPTEDEIPLYQQVTDEFRDHRLTKIDETVTADEFYEVTKEYIERNLEKKQLFIVLDHIGIIRGTNKTESIHDIMENVNRLKLEYPGKLTFIILCQLNREIENRWRNKDTNPFVLSPDSSSIYGSDSILFFSDIVMIQVIPQVVGMEKYALINRERNPHLEEFITDDDRNSPKDWVRLKGQNRIYYHYLKVRLMDGDPTIYGAVLNPEQEEYNIAAAQFEKDMTDNEPELIF